MTTLVLVLLIVAMIAAIVSTSTRQAWPWLHVAVILIAAALIIPLVPGLSR